MKTIMELPNCYYPRPPINITPCAPTPNHTLYLTNIDDHTFFRVYTQFVYVFKKFVGMDTLKSSLSRVLFHYYPLAGRFRISSEDENKLVVDCNGEGVVFVEASMDITVEELLTSSMMTKMSWNKFNYNVEVEKGIDYPPIVIQVTSLSCKGMVLCASISHSMCDGTGSSQFLNAWAEITRNPNTNLTIIPFHNRQLLKNHNPLKVNFSHPSIFTKQTKTEPNSEPNFSTWFHSQQIVPVSFIFGVNEVVRLKKQCTKTSSFNYVTSFEALAAHTWRSFVKACNWPQSCNLKFDFPVNFRKNINFPKGYYGNGIVPAVLESTVKDIVAPKNLDHCVKLVQQAKANVDEEYINSMIDMLKDKTLILDGSRSLFVMSWNRLGLENIDFGEGVPLYIGPLSIDFGCVFLPVFGDPNAIRVLLSVPKNTVEKFEHYMTEIESWEKDE